MNFDEWWATLTPPERRVVGESNARFVWKEAVRACGENDDMERMLEELLELRKQVKELKNEI
jgi:hypothetical protein